MQIRKSFRIGIHEDNRSSLSLSAEKLGNEGFFVFIIYDFVSVFGFNKLVGEILIIIEQKRQRVGKPCDPLYARSRDIGDAQVMVEHHADFVGVGFSNTGDQRCFQLRADLDRIVTGRHGFAERFLMPVFFTEQFVYGTFFDLFVLFAIMGYGFIFPASGIRCLTGNKVLYRDKLVVPKAVIAVFHTL